MTENRRDRIFWQVVANAATKPANLLAAAGMVALGILTGQGLIALAALPVYGLLVGATIKSPKEQERVAKAQSLPQPIEPRSLEGISGDLRRRVVDAMAEERGIHEELLRMGDPPAGVADEVTNLCDQVLATARKATEVDLYLASVDVDNLHRRLAEYERMGTLSDRAQEAADAIREQLTVLEQLTQRRADLDGEIGHTIASLGAVRARLVQARTMTGGAGDVADEMRELRERMRVLAESLQEAFGEGESTTGDNAGQVQRG